MKFPLKKGPAPGRASLLFARILLLISVMLPGTPDVLAGLPEPGPLTPVVAGITTLDETGAALALMRVFAINHEYGFRVEGLTDGSGQVALELMSGTWTFLAYPRLDALWALQGKAYYLVSAGRQLGPSPVYALTLEPTETIPVSLSSSALDFSSPGRSNYVGFVALPYGKYVEASPAGVTQSSEITLYTNAGIQARSFVSSPSYDMESVYFVQPAQLLSGSLGIEVNADNSGLLEFVSLAATGAPAASSVQLHTDSLSWMWTPGSYSGPPGPLRIRVSAHDFMFYRSVEVEQGEETYRLNLNGNYVEVKSGEEIRIEAGGPLSGPMVRITPRPSEHFPSRTQLMALVRDAHNNFVNSIMVGPTWIWPEVVVHHGGATSDPFENFQFFTAGLGEVFDRSESPSYEVTWDYGPWGSGSATGPVYGQEERRMDYHETAGLLSQIPRFDEPFRVAQVKTYEQLISAMESTLGVPTDYKQGVISNINWVGFEDEVQHGFKLELGAEINKATAYRGLVTGEAGYIAHEAGHGRMHKPPAWFFAAGYYESYATLSGLKAASLLYGGEEYLKYYLGNHNFFMRHLHGEPIKDVGDQIETMQFITHYINTHYGWTPHRRMILEWANAFTPLWVALETGGFTEIEKFAIIYSWLCSENLGVLFELAGFQVSDGAVANGLVALGSYFNSISEPALRFGGHNRVEAPRTSLAVELSVPLLSAVTGMGFALNFDPLKVRLEKLYKRDLTHADTWRMTANEISPGHVRVDLIGSTALTEIGSVVQFNFSILPGVSGVLPFTLSDVSIDGIGRPDAQGSLNAPATPLIGPFPSLPSALTGAAYHTTLWAIGGEQPCTWTVVEDELPAGLELNAANGVISGVSSALGEYLFRARCTDASAQQVHRWFTIHVTDTAHVLEVNIHGRGSGTVTSAPVGIGCPDACSQAVAEHTVVYLTATPDPHNEFIGWSGNDECSDGILVMDEPYICNAIFNEMAIFADGFE